MPRTPNVERGPYWQTGQRLLRAINESDKSIKQREYVLK